MDPDWFFQVVGDGVRRGHSFKLFKKRYRLDVRKLKFASRVCDEWNRLGDGIVSAGTVNGYLLVSNLQTPTARLSPTSVRLVSGGSRLGIYKHLLFSPADDHP